MLDGFFEAIVKHHKTPKEQLSSVGLFFAGLFGALVILFITDKMNLHIVGIFGALAAFVFGVRAAILYTWEYEYILTASVLDIDQIFAQRKRKRVFSFDSRDCEIIAPFSRGNYYQEYASLPLLNYSAYTAHPDNYFAVFERQGVRTCVLFQPTENMVQHLKQINPKKVFTA